MQKKFRTRNDYLTLTPFQQKGGCAFMKLYGKTVLFLGSSVTYGSAAGGVSFADLMAESCGIVCIKEAVSGTTLADTNRKSYVARLKKVNADTKVDLFICQLSTNDAAKKISLQKTEDAIRFILQYAEDTFACPILFYTGTYFKSEAYEAMIHLLYDLQKEYDFYILDLFNDKTMQGISLDLYKKYMHDPVHPTFVGYKEWWTPKFITFCENLTE